jgi:hypothetical protein
MGSQASGRPGRNPDFGTKYKLSRSGEESFDKLLQLRITATMIEKLNKLGDKKNQFIRDALQQALDKLET